MTHLQLPIDEVRFAVIDVESNGGVEGDHRLIERGRRKVGTGTGAKKHEEENRTEPHSPMLEENARKLNACSSGLGS